MLKRKTIESAVGAGVGTELMVLFGRSVFKRQRIRIAGSSCTCWAKAKFLNEKGTEWCREREVKVFEYVRQEFKIQRGRDVDPVVLDFDEKLVRSFVNRAQRRASK